jgi:hypothetical protein
LLKNNASKSVDKAAQKWQRLLMPLPPEDSASQPHDDFIAARHLP